MQKTTYSIDRYMNRVFKLVVLALPGVTVCAGLTFTIIKLLGYYPDVPNISLLLFDITNVLYMVLGIVFVRRCEDENGILIPSMLKQGKILIAVIEAIQWNYITYMIPSGDFWGYAVLFVILVTVFLDHKFVLIVSAEIIVSIAVSWIIRGDVLLPARDAYFVPNLILRIVCIVLSLAVSWIITYLVEMRLASDLEKLSIFDELTQLYNRKNMDRLLSESIAASEGSPYTFVMCDIDDFKKVNDVHGHLCGDEILKLISNIIIRNVAGYGFAFRYGGEEILILLNEGRERAFEIAEHIRKDIEQASVTYGGKKISVTVTMGLAESSLSSKTEVLIKMADENMYYGKQHGKNVVIS